MAKFDQLFEQTDVKKPETHPRRETKWLHYTKLIDNVAQYCDEKDLEEIKALASLIDADKGVLQNLLVRKVDADEYEIIAGHKRRRACRYLVEEEGKKEYEFLPCTVQNISDVLAEFQVYSSNSHHVKTDYERMHELERMKYLLETYPEEFPHLQTGRMVERLAKQMNLSRTTVGEYLTISNNLSDAGREEFEKGTLKKSAAVEMSTLPVEEQKDLITKGITSHKEIKCYKEDKESKSKGDSIQKSYSECAAFKMYKSCKSCHYFLHNENCPYDCSEIGAYGKPILVHSADSLLEDNGCGTDSCYSCSMDCAIRLEKRYCCEAPMGNPFDCTTMNVIESLRCEKGDVCQFINHELAYHRTGDQLASPCCKKCEDKDCGYRCNRSCQEQCEKSQEDKSVSEQLPGQLKVVNTDMDVEEDVPNSGTEELEVKELPTIIQEHKISTREEAFSPKYFLSEQSEKLDQMLHAIKCGANAPQKVIERQKTIVSALTSMVSDLENVRIKEEIQLLSQPELPQMKNNDQRKEWLHNYKEWGVWYRDENIGAVFYKYDFSDGTRLIAETYEGGQYSSDYGYMHLVGGPKKRDKGKYGEYKYPYHERYSKHPDSETELVEFLKDIQKY